jgi:hypothetical protein
MIADRGLGSRNAEELADYRFEMCNPGNGFEVQRFLIRETFSG